LILPRGREELIRKCEVLHCTGFVTEKIVVFLGVALASDVNSETWNRLISRESPIVKLSPDMQVLLGEQLAK
jgi:hypothetical protein